MMYLVVIAGIELMCMNALYRYDLMLKKQEFRDALRGQLIMQLGERSDCIGGLMHECRGLVNARIDNWCRVQEAKKH